MTTIEETNNEVTTSQTRKQNLLALSILLGGLFIGSLFVDFVQLLRGEGFSSWATQTHTVLEAAGKTWVGYSDPKVSLQVLTDKNCTTCDPNEALVWLRRVIPTLEATRVDISDSYGQTLAERFGVVTLPAFIFSKDILHTDFYSQASSLFVGNEGRYFFDMSKIGLPAGRYLKQPVIDEHTIVSGPEKARLTIVEFSDFECSYCATLHRNLKEAVRSYKDELRVVYKHFPLSSHAQATNAALAAECAHAQGKFDLYADYLFSKQAEWSKVKGTQKFKDYAWWLKLDGRAFSACLESGEYLEQISRNKEEGTNLLLTSTPSTFIGGTLLDGAVSTQVIRDIIDQELAK